MQQDRLRRGQRDASPSEPNSGGISGAILSIFRNRGVREVVESIVIAFALAFLFRTFEAEAFVIPTGSMAPTLVGRHRDVDCPKCHYHYRVSASLEIDQASEQQIGNVVAATCPQCGYTACVDPKAGLEIEREVRRGMNPVFNSGAFNGCQSTSSSNGNRILVSKFAYELREPRRWDVFVFRPPGDAAKNYIKRLVGLPGETLRIYRGDLYTGDYNPAAFENPAAVKYQIERKPPDKVLSMKQLVYDNDYLLDSMTQQGWPTRWSTWPRGEAAAAGAWQSNDGTRTFTIDGTSPAPHWVRYQHFLPTFGDWEELVSVPTLGADYRRRIRPQLITDLYGYNSSVGQLFSTNLDCSDSTFQGVNWVPDLVLECELTVDKPQGAALLELVAGGVPFRCRIDLATGGATLSMDKQGAKYVFTNQQPQLTAQTPMRTAGSYRLRLANVDHQIHLWVNNQLVQFSAPAKYEELDNVIPETDAQSGLDLAPVGVGSEGAALRVAHLRIDRDVYYIAIKAETHRFGPAMDFLTKRLPQEFLAALPSRVDDIHPDFQSARASLFSTPAYWPQAFGQLREVAFPLGRFADSREDQFLALGDNSPQSRDSRLWQWTRSMRQSKLGAAGGVPREYYIERDLLIGRALLVYWPITHAGFVR